MGDSKDITDMSFEEFFSESKTKVEREENRKAEAQKNRPEKAAKVTKGFVGATPKLNFNNGKFLLYMPRFAGGENDQFNVAVECDDRIVPMGRLEFTKRGSSRVTRPDTIDLTPADVTPMDDFKVMIDETIAFDNKAHPISFFNSLGSAVARPMGDITAVCKAGSQLKMFKTELLETTIKNGLSIFRLNILTSGSVKIDENASNASPEEEPAQEAEAVVESEPTVVEEKPKKKPAKKVAVKGSIALSQSIQEADVIYGKDKLPLYAGGPVLTVDVTGCDPSECTVRLEGKEGDISSSAASPQMILTTNGYGGPITVCLEKGAKKLATAKYFIIPDFECKFAGKGDIVEDTKVEYKIFGESGVRDVKDKDPYSFDLNGMKFKVIWYVPVVTFDMGDGEVPFTQVEVNAVDLKDTMKVTVRGAKKKGLFLGGLTGKKTELVPEWEDETCEINLAKIREDVISVNKESYIYITVNSFPNRKFVTIKNPVRMTAEFKDGNVVVGLDSSTECVCRLYKIDKTVEEVRVTADSYNVPVSENVVEVEVVEIRNGQPLTTIPVAVRSMPFIHRDTMGDKWMYVSKDKRIPLPDDLYKDGKADMPAVRAWHDRIVRMNPELKGVTSEMIQKAFKDFE